MAGVSLGISEARFEEVRHALAHIPGGAEKAVARALNRAAESARNDAAQLMKERYTMKVSDFKKEIVILRATPGNLKAVLLTRSARQAITDFEHAPAKPPRQKGIPARLRPRAMTTIVAGRTKNWSHAFLARMKSGHLGLWTRSKTEKTAKGKPVIHEFFTLAVPQMMGSGPIITRVLKTAQHRLGVELDRQVAYIAGGGRT